MSLLRSISTVGQLTILSRILGFLRDQVMASYIGAGPVMDAVVVAIKIPSFFRRLFAEGAFNAAFVPLFSGTLSTDGKSHAITHAEEIMSFLLFILFVIVVFVEIFATPVVTALVYGFKDTPERLQLAINFTRITFPYLILISLTALYSGILNSLDRFAAAASSPAAGNLFLLGVLLYVGDVASVGYFVAFSILLSGVVQLLWVICPTHRYGYGLRLLRPRLTPNVKKFLQRMVPGAIGSGVVQINLFIGTLIASFLPLGSVSYLYYADRLNQLPLSVIGTAISTALLPLMSRQLRQKNFSGAVHNQNRALEFGLLLVLPATLSLIIGAEPFVRVLFERGEFSAYDTHQTALGLMGYACGLPAYIFIKIFSTSFFAREDTKTPVITAGISVAIDIIFSLLLFSTLHHVGIALATAISSWANAGIMGYLLRKRSLLSLDPRLIRFLPRVLLATTLTGIVVAVSVFLTESLIASSFLLEKVLGLVLIVGGGLISFFSVILLTGAMKLKEVFQSPPS